MQGDDVSKRPSFIGILIGGFRAIRLAAICPISFLLQGLDWTGHGLDDDALRALEIAIMAGPWRAPVVEGTGGLRKVRYAPPGSHKGKSGSYRVCYVHFDEYGCVWLVAIFGKNEKSDLTKAECKAAAKLIEEMSKFLENEEL